MRVKQEDSRHSVFGQQACVYGGLTTAKNEKDGQACTCKACVCSNWRRLICVYIKKMLTTTPKLIN